MLKNARTVALIETVYWLKSMLIGKQSLFLQTNGVMSDAFDLRIAGKKYLF